MMETRNPSPRCIGHQFPSADPWNPPYKYGKRGSLGFVRDIPDYTRSASAVPLAADRVFFESAEEEAIFTTEAQESTTAETTLAAQERGSVGGVANFALAFGAPQPVGFSGFAPAPPAMAAFGPPGHDNATTASPSTDLGKLYDLQWLTNALSGTSGWLHLPLTNGTKSFRLGLDQDNTPFEACSLPEGDVAPAGNSTAHCRHLHHCIVPEIVQDIMQYVRYFCNIGEYAGVCCPDRLFVPVR